MIRTAWNLGGQERYAELNLRRWAHMLAFRGHFLTKSQRYSVTFRAIRADRRLWRLVQDLTELGERTDDPNEIPPDPTTVTVINEWWPVRFGHRDDGERELAAAIAEKHRARRTTRTTPTRSAA
jgi:hypothetical protein